ncbi:MAG: nuclear transport factor 2 family protein [Deltaproteobacteria bacterium]|nr:nuclear transport factor 2 family protein [Deltaproteobacteria bacterium]
MANLEDIEAIKKLKHKYMRCVDTKQLNDLKDCFVDDASAAYAGGKYSFKGRDNIVAFLRNMMPETLITMHIAFHPEIEITGDTTAKGSWGFQDYLIEQTSNVSLRGYAYYQDEYVKVDGQWKIKSTGYKRVFEESWSRADIESLKVSENMFAPSSE